MQHHILPANDLKNTHLRMQVRVQYRRMHTVPEAYAPKVRKLDKVFEVMVTCPGNQRIILLQFDLLCKKVQHILGHLCIINKSDRLAL